jgi:hypothetical protein
MAKAYYRLVVASIVREPRKITLLDTWSWEVVPVCQSHNGVGVIHIVPSQVRVLRIIHHQCPPKTIDILR